MPTYEYECMNCGYKFEKFQSIKAQPLKKCPKCGKNKLHRLISMGAGIIFKGSGFYVTDYKRNVGVNSTKSEKNNSKSKHQEGLADS